MSDEHSRGWHVDPGLGLAKSFRPKDGSDDGDGSEHPRPEAQQHDACIDTDGDARLYKNSYGKESKLSYLGHALGRTATA